MSVARDVEIDVRRDDQEEQLLVTVESRSGSIALFVPDGTSRSEIRDLVDDVSREIDWIVPCFEEVDR